MGYTTDFEGSFSINPPLKEEHLAYLKKFNETRRMKRDEVKASTFEDPIRVAVGLPVGVEGEYTVFGGGYYGQDRDGSILNYNESSKNQPGLWCKWTPNEAGTALEWDGGEKFYDYIEWLTYLNEHFFQPWGYRLGGSVSWQGEEDSDHGIIIIDDGITDESNGVKLIKHEVKNKISLKKN